MNSIKLIGIVLIVSGFVLILVGFGIIIGTNHEQNKIRTEFYKAKHAPIPILIGDSIYIIRYYPLNTVITREAE
jgi:hypothetical protein